MPKVTDINAVSISLEIDDDTALFILLDDQGTINRMGTGAVNNQEKDLFIGLTEEPLFEKLKETMQDEMLNHMGGYDVPDKIGAECTLSIAFSFTNDEQNGFGFKYGSESDGPPYEIVQFVTAAVQLTAPWFQEQKEMANSAETDD